MQAKNAYNECRVADVFTSPKARNVLVAIEVALVILGALAIIGVYLPPNGFGLNILGSAFGPFGGIVLTTLSFVALCITVVTICTARKTPVLNPQPQNELDQAKIENADLKQEITEIQKTLCLKENEFNEFKEKSRFAEDQSRNELDQSRKELDQAKIENADLKQEITEIQKILCLKENEFNEFKEKSRFAEDQSRNELDQAKIENADLKQGITEIQQPLLLNEIECLKLQLEQDVLKPSNKKVLTL